MNFEKARRSRVGTAVRTNGLMVARFGLPGRCLRASQVSAAGCAGANRFSRLLVVTAAGWQSGHWWMMTRAASPVACRLLPGESDPTGGLRFREAER
jgi:hypothetical protein